jgi:hypothetical protein
MRDSSRRRKGMGAQPKKAEVKVKHPPRATGRKASAAEMHERAAARFPKTMRRLGE